MHYHSIETISKGYIECAINDRVAANLLFENGQYPLAIYHLQQYIEKLSKCFMLTFEKCNVNDVIRCHDILEVLKREQVRLGQLKKNNKMNLIEWANGLETLTAPNLDMFLKINGEFMNLGLKRFPEIIGNLSEEQLIETSRFFGTITTLVVFTRHHSMFPRYPAIKSNDRNYSEYDQNSGIVKMFPFLIRHANMIEDLLKEKMRTEFGPTLVPSNIA